MDQTLRASIQTSTFYYFMIVMVLTTISQLSTMMVIVFADIEGKESVVAASVIGPCLIGSFGIIRLLTNMTLLVSDMDDKMKSSNYGNAMQSIPFPILKILFAIIFVIIAIIQFTDVFRRTSFPRLVMRLVVHAERERRLLRVEVVVAPLQRQGLAGVGELFQSGVVALERAELLAQSLEPEERRHHSIARVPVDDDQASR